MKKFFAQQVAKNRQPSGEVDLAGLGSRRTAELSAREAALEEQNLRFHAAINHMSQGLLMFDSEARLLICNRRYLELYGFSPEHARPGVKLATMLRQRAEMGSFSGDPDEYIAYLLDALAQGKIVTRIMELPNGRIISVVNHPMPGGGWVATHEDITERRRAEQQIAHMARHDALTDLPNRVLLSERLSEALTAGAHRNEMLAVLYLDLDHFKGVNDTLGHSVGDELLKAIAERLRRCIKETDTVARIGGDEFAVIQTNIDSPPEAAMLARLICETIKAPYDLNEHVVIADTSIGIAIAPNDGDAVDELLKNADMALYGAKADGRGTYRFFEAEMDARMKGRRAMELALRKALELGEFELHYQPLLDLERDCVACCEALLRWRHPERGMILPREFIPIAEEIGLIVPLGEWVMRQACLDAASWPLDVRLAVNLSPSQLINKSLLGVVINALAFSGLSAHRLDLEITEDVLMQNNEATIASLHRLRELGVRISLDDFGTGYSSLRYLRSFPFDKIKIDRCFINGLPDAEDSLAIVRAVTGLATSLRVTTTAEGVETQEQLAQVRALGCTEIQGLIFSAPRPAVEIARFLAPDRAPARRA